MKLEKRKAVLVVFMSVLVLYANALYFRPASDIARYSGTVLSDNWWEALNWIRNNTAECAVVATYWDPGHFITGIAKRPVVFDGATQGAVLEVPGEQESGTVIERHENGISRVLLYRNGNVTTARIQDIATTLLTENETLATEVLEKYKKPNCDEFYYIASSDLLGKSQWWTYFATWDPAGGKNCPLISSDKGYCYLYTTVSLSRASPIPSQNAIAYTYPLSQRNAFVIYEINSTLIPYFQQDNQLSTVESIFYFTKDGIGRIRTAPDADLPGLIWMDPSKQVIVFIPLELANSLFTRMFLFNGAGLEKFEFVNSWGGEVKLFKVNFE